MNYKIIGTAGHVDHGKTSLIKALTGVNTDRLKEEQKRGITIELGFASLETPFGEKIGIVDVPGHEKFIKNMLAGVGGTDLALLVIAADEGIMPQTREHLDILNLLKVSNGVVAITKIDMVDPEWLEVVMEDIKEELDDSVLRNAPLVPVSAYNMDGIDNLKEILIEKIEMLEKKDISLPIRLHVDRVFSMDGFGTVITGSLLEGMIRENEDIIIYPSGIKSKVRNIQVHDKVVNEAFAGQRVAVNLTVKKTDIRRGDTIASSETLVPSYLIDANVEILPSTKRKIISGSSVHFHYGTRELLAKIVLLDKNELPAGGSGYVQFHFSEPVVLKKGDHYVIRFYSPLETIGGGTVLDPVPQKHKRFDGKVLENLNLLNNGTLIEQIETLIAVKSFDFPKIKMIKNYFYSQTEKTQYFLCQLMDDGKIIQFSDDVLVHKDFILQIEKKSSSVLKNYHTSNPLSLGMNVEEFRKKVLAGKPQQMVDQIMLQMQKDGILQIKGSIVFKSEFQIKPSNEHSLIKQKLIELYKKDGFAPREKKDIEAEFSAQKNDFNMVFSAMISSGELIQISSQIVYLKEVFEKALDMLCQYLSVNDSILLGEFRDLIGTSRKYAVAFLEYLDSKKITKKNGDKRVLH